MLGVGIGYRSDIKNEIMEFQKYIDWLEFHPDHYIEKPSKFYEIEELKKHFPLCPHSLSLSIGSPTKVNSDYLGKIKEYSDKVDSPWASDHLCFTNADGIELGHLTPVERTDETLEYMVNNIKYIKNTLGREFLVENITYDFELPTNEYKETEYINKVISNADCGLLLDVTNVFINSQNHGFDPYNYIDEIDLDRVVEIHLAGGIKEDGKWIDSHSERINQEVWEILDYTLRKTPTKGILLELDAKFPKKFQVVIDELVYARTLMSKHRG